MSAAVLQPVQKVARVLIVDDHHLLLEALSFVLAPRFKIACASSLAQVDSQIASFHPDVVVFDIAMPDGDGVATCQRLIQRHSNVKFIFLSMHSGAERRRAIGTGAHGYVSKSSSADELTRAIDTVLDGGNYHSSTDSSAGIGNDEPILTHRQTQVLRLVAHGFSAKEIATELKISVRTAEFHRGAIMQRLEMHSTALLTRYAVQNALV